MRGATWDFTRSPSAVIFEYTQSRQLHRCFKDPLRLLYVTSADLELSAEIKKYSRPKIWIRSDIRLGFRQKLHRNIPQETRFIWRPLNYTQYSLDQPVHVFRRDPMPAAIESCDIEFNTG
jgi:hypothetical protein